VKRLIVLIVVAFVCVLLVAPGASAFISTGDGSWVWQNPLPQGNRLYDVDFVDASHGWVVGASGLILATTDGGTTWVKQISGTHGPLRAVAFADTLHGWAAEYPILMGGGDPHVAYATSDGGKTWVEQDAASGMEDFACLDAQRVWAAGGQRILSTNDGGATWDERWSDPLTALHGVYFVDAMHGWAVGASSLSPGVSGPAVILTTADGGVTWAKQDSGVMYTAFDDIVFADTTHGWVVGQDAGLYATTDGGATWTKQQVSDTAGFCAVACTDASHVWAVTGQSQWIQSADGGATWEWRHFDHQRDILGVSFSDAEHGCMVCDAGIIDVTADGGSTWQRKSSGVLYDLYGVSFADASRGIAVGEAGCILTTANGGGAWTKQVSGTTAALKSVFCLDASRAWAVGGYEAILATSDGGESWTLQHSIAEWWQLNDVTFADALHGWAVGRGVIYRTTDGGAHWSESKAPVQEYWTGVSFIDRSRGWVVGGGGYHPGTILATKDGGVTWVVQWRKARTFPQGVFFLDRLHGWADDWRTTDGGVTWTLMKTAVGAAHDITFVDASRGWELAGGVFAITTDGGAHWMRGHPGNDGGGSLLNGACLFDAHHAWLVGDNGAILATKTGGVPPVTTTASGAVGGRWYRGPVTATLKVTDNTGGVGVAYTEYKLDDAPWVKGRSFTVSGEGRHVVRYRSADNDMNLEYDHRLAFGIDTVRPTTKAPSAEGVTRGHQMALQWIVVDPAPNAGWATVTIKIRNGAGVVVKTLGPYKKQAVNTRNGATATCTLQRGLYRFYVYANDAAGNPQKLPVGSNRLRVY